MLPRLPYEIKSLVTLHEVGATDKLRGRLTGRDLGSDLQQRLPQCVCFASIVFAGRHFRLLGPLNERRPIQEDASMFAALAGAARWRLGEFKSQ